MSIEETVNFFISNTIAKTGNRRFDFFCGMTNDISRRLSEHRASKILVQTQCSDKQCARELMRQLHEAKFDVDPDIMSGQDDSLYVYAYKKNQNTVQILSRTVTINFQKRWYAEEKIDELPNTNGIYCCYSSDKELKDGFFQNNKPLYIGLATNGFRNRIMNHQSIDHDDWKKHQKVDKNKQLVYGIAEFDDSILQTVESALIYKNQTPENKEYIDGYQGEYHTITVNCTGAKGNLKGSITATFGV